MTLASGDILFKVRGTDEEVALRLDRYFATHARAEVNPDDLLEVLCPNEPRSRFKVIYAGATASTLKRVGDRLPDEWQLQQSVTLTPLD